MKHLTRLTTLCLLLTACTGMDSLPQPVAFHEEVLEGPFEEAVDASNRILAKAMRKQSLPSISISIGVGLETIWTQAVGFSDLEEREVATVNSKYRIGSISKSLTSLALGRLFEQGQLDFDRSIHDYVPYFPRKRHDITLGELASHTSGLRHYSWKLLPPFHEFVSKTQYESIEDAVSVFKDDKLEFEPGTDYSYSSYGYTLLSAAIEEITAQEFTAYMETAILRPQQLEDTVPEVAGVQDLVSFYETTDGSYKRAATVNNSNKWAAGGYVSTAQDLVSLGNRLLGYQILQRGTVNLLFTPNRWFPNGTSNLSNYALGWRSQDVDLYENGSADVRIVHHGGTSVGASSFLVLLPDSQVAVALLTNTEIEDVNEFYNIAFDVAKEFMRVGAERAR